MSERYEPASDFLRSIIAEEVSLSGSEFADANFRRLIEMTTDEDLSNRDWATMLLSQSEIDTPEVRMALLIAARDGDEVVRAEALLGLAQRNKAIALPLVVAELSSARGCMPLFDAAAVIADPSLVPLLRPWAEPSGDAFLDSVARDALTACEAGTPVL